MAKNKGNLPELLFVAPIGRGRDKIRHQHVVFEVIEMDDDGIPTLCRMMKETETVDLGSAKYKDRQARFMTGYVQAVNLVKARQDPPHGDPPVDPPHIGDPPGGES